MKAFVIGGAVSGVGKTTVSIGLMAALCRRGLKLQPFKTGPDYIDPGYHTLVTGVPSRNLDSWMVSHEGLLELYQRAMLDKEIAVVEGVMGLFDGKSAVTDEGSTAELAKLLGAPVLLVLDAKKGARSLAAMALGYRTFDRELKIAGVILNGIGSPFHYDLCSQAVEHYTGTPVLGYLPKNEKLSLPERHLGLVTAVERPATQEYLDHLVAQIESSFDIDRILELSECNLPTARRRLFPSEPRPKVVRIGVARDQAFSFYYQDNLDLLEAWGAELVFFSPILDGSLPAKLDGIYIGGGFPELYADRLSENQPLKQQIRQCAEEGLPIYAECGGLMYLGKSIADFEGRSYPMVEAVDSLSRIDSHRLSLGYRTVTAMADGPLMKQGQTTRGHEFHWSVLDNPGDRQNAYRVLENDGRSEGFQKGNLLASYIHLHFASLPSLAPRFVEVCRDFHNRRLL